MRLLGLASASVGALAVAGCHSDAPAAVDPSGNDAGDAAVLEQAFDAAGDATPPAMEAGPPPPPIAVGPDGGSVVGLSISPLALTPAFAPTTTDYYVACSAGTNDLTVNATYSSGSEAYSVEVVENQAIVVAGQYWIRCLPHDFPSITVTSSPDSGGPTPGYYLVNSKNYAIVLDTNGVPVWYEQGPSVLNVDSPRLDALSFMPNGMGPFGTSTSAAFNLLDLDALARTTVVAADGPTDAHEYQTLANGDHLVFTYLMTPGVDLSDLPKLTSNETMADCEIEEVDPAGNLVWSWRTSDHVDPVKESLEPTVTPLPNGQNVVDAFHCNSIDVDATGNLLLSLRQANALFYISRSTGQVLWKFGGSAYSKDGAALIATTDDSQTTFSMQHDARFQPNGDVTLFDDHGGVTTGVARGVEYAIDHESNTASVVWQYLGSGQAQYEGSFRRYDDGESVIGWGYVPKDPRVVTEVDADGNDVLDIAFGGTGNLTYRAVKVPLSQFDLGVLRRTTAQ
jgi:hypothetical protein